MLKPLLLVPAVVLFALGTASSPAIPPQEGATPPTKAQKAEAAKAGSESAARAKKIFELDCALCHNSNGNGKTDLAKDMALNLNDFTDPKTLGSMTDEQLFDLIRKGKDKMPGEDPNRAKNDEVKALIQYIRSLSKDQPSTPAAPAPAAAAATAQAPSSK